MQTRELTVATGAKHMRRILAVMAFGLALCVMLIGSGNGASAGVPVGIPTANQAGKIEPVVLQDTAGGKSTSVMVLLADQANVDAANSMNDQDARGWYVYNTLTSHAQRTQASLRASLDAQGVKYRSFWAVNAVALTVDRTLLETLAARSDVGKIESNRPSRWIEDPEIANFGVANDSPEVIELGVQNVNAPQVWAMGFTGQGIVIGNQDTGVRWTHNAIKPKYRGWDGATADHNYNWWDAIHSGGGSCGPNTIEPCDDNSHGTHTTGTTSGDDGAGNQIGVAPGAKWIGCRNMDQGNGTPATYTECFEFFIAPTDLTGNNPNPALRPHVMNNSWSCPPSEGCAADSLETIVNNTVAAGIFVVVSAGNAGSACGTVNTPAAIYAASFTVGAITASTNAIASFSSRGPVTVDGSNRMKPDISAPGVSVRSSTNSGDTTYASFNGTSMAGPHVVGVVALLWSARPQLERDIPNTKLVLQDSANPNVVVSPVQTCGGVPSSDIPNNTFGWGRVDALAAVNSVQKSTPTPTLTPVPATPTTAPTNTVGPTNTPGGPTSTPIPCTITFTDVLPDDYFYTPVEYLYCHGAISGYPDNTFRPYNNTTRSQMVKIVVLGFGITPINPVDNTFADVLQDNVFYTYVEAAAANNIASGYPCGGDGEPCDSENRPYFRPYANVTRGQLSKIDVVAAGWALVNPSNNTFADVLPATTFYQYVETVSAHGVVGGYPCGGDGEPCDSENRPYFRQFNDAIRGQIAKIVYLSIKMP